MAPRWSWVLLLACAAPSAGQELEPGAYSISPVGVNILVATYNFSGGDVTFDPALPVENAEASIHSAAFAYVRSVNLFGRSGNVGFVAPYSVGHVEGLYIGEFTEVDRSGFRDPGLRFAVNLYGAPAMDLKGFASYRQKTNVGMSLVVALPLGEYDEAKLINLGSNRFSFKPEVGLSHALGKWTLELYGGVWLFTDNEDFYGGKTREQAAIGSVQIHVLYTFKPRLWVAVDGNFYSGGRTTVDGVANLDLQKNSRLGTTFSYPLGPRHSLKVAFSRGAYTTIGADFTSLVVGYQYLWGAGL
jgi:hypothetical protein